MIASVAGLLLHRARALAPVVTGALEIARATRPDLMLLDWMLPGLDGLEVCRELRADADPRLRDLPVVLLTGHAGDDNAAIGFAAGVTDYVTKPFSPAYIRSRVHTWLLRRAAGSVLCPAAALRAAAGAAAPAGTARSVRAVLQPAVGARRLVIRRLSTALYIRNRRWALPLRILTLSSSQSGMVSIQSTAGWLATNGQSTANKTRSMPSP